MKLSNLSLSNKINLIFWFITIVLMFIRYDNILIKDWTRLDFLLNVIVLIYTSFLFEIKFRNYNK